MTMSRFLIIADLAVVLAIAISLPSTCLGQFFNNPCTPSMITSFTSCMNYPTNRSVNGTTTPTTDCCNSMKSLMTSGKDCLCLVATTSIPFQIPLNRTFIGSLPRACNMSGVPLQCKANGDSSGAPPDGPSASSPPPPSVAVTPPPQTASPPPSPPALPASGAGAMPWSAGQPACPISPFSFLGAMLGILVLKYY